jgi:hypothetical protein
MYSKQCGINGHSRSQKKVLLHHNLVEAQEIEVQS